MKINSSNGTAASAEPMNPIVAALVSQADAESGGVESSEEGQESFNQRLEGAELAASDQLAAQAASRVSISPKGKEVSLASEQVEKSQEKAVVDAQAKTLANGPRDRAIQNVQTQEINSARTNAVDALTGLQPWDKNWVFKRDDIALNPDALAAEKQMKSQGLGGIALELKKLETQLRGEAEAARKKTGAPVEKSSNLNQKVDTQVAQATPQPAPVHEQVVRQMMQQASEPAASQAASQATQVPGASSSQELAALAQAMGLKPEQMEGSSTQGTQRKVNSASPSKNGKGAERIATDDFLGMHGAGQNAKVIRLGPVQKAEPLIEEGPVGTWKPHRAKSGLSGADLRGQNGPVFGDAAQAALANAGHASASSALAQAMAGGQANFAPQPREVTAWVTQGSMAQDRLSSEAMVGIGNGLRSISTNGGGEMKIRLRPDHLGELLVRVNTKGNEVALEIKASDDRARRVIEDSVGYLRDSLSSQNLTVSRIDLSVASPTGAQNGGFDLSQQQQGNPDLASQWNAGGGLGQSQGDQRGARDSRESSDSDGIGLSRTRNSGAAARTQSAFSAGGTLGTNQSSGRIDLMA